MERINFELYDLENEKKLISKEYRKLLRTLKNRLNPSSKKSLRHAFDMAVEAHSKTRRKSGELYIFHPIAVAQIVTEEIGLGVTSAICALLHDTVEDTDLAIEEIQISLGNEVAKIVEGLTKISHMIDTTSSMQIENYKKLIITLAEDVRVILIKIADRLHNMRTMDAMAPDKQKKIASETLFLYAPLANRIGLHAIKTELEDLSLKYLEPKEYREIALKLKETKRQRTKQINEFIQPIEEKLNKLGYKFKIYGRPKSIYSIWNKIHKKDVPFEEVFDLLAVRIILEVPLDKEKQECWNVYSIITESYIPSSERLRDWISKPKSNGYEALHTTVMGPSGKFIEVQIRTSRMDELAERGVAAHLFYKEGKTGNEKNPVDEWLKKMSEKLKASNDNALDLVDDFKLDLYNEEIYVFTPKGDLKMMPQGSTILDFAFEIHSGVGRKCIGAKVNHKLVPISHKIENGTQIEILTSGKQKPNEDWLNIVTTSKAKSAIKNSLKSEIRAEAALGKEILVRKLSAIHAIYNQENLQILVNHYKYTNHLSLLCDIKNEKINLQEIKKFKVVAGIIKLDKPKRIKENNTEISDKDVIQKVKETLKKNSDLLIMGEDSSKIKYSYASCCNPIPGDDVFGFITINEGVKIHRINCPNAVQLMSKYNYRIVKTKWSQSKEIAFLTGFKLNGIDGLGLINKMTKIISEDHNVNIRSISIESEEGIFEGTVKLYVNDIEQLETLISNLKTLDGVIDIKRIEE
ncbi:MAG: RelA/SpoT family protein [Chitinophagales bacterium]|jgi:guanosine-3',5'-bis(diphosphate) 3'-pyrophosphohydrolase|nr:RelA/SpoT family protein [Sphingobacteriales bacterium]